jgi:hypothetical protein
MNHLLLDLVRLVDEIAGDPGKSMRVAAILSLIVALAAILRS